LRWLKQSLSESRATWKILCSDMPLGVIIGDSMEGKPSFEGVANGNPGVPMGRELEMANLLAWIKSAEIKNTLWLTADIHYAAAHHYHPDRADRKLSFSPFWEFVAGPLHAGTFGPNALDGTFGPEVRFQWAPPAGTKLPLPPSAGMQSFGTVRIDGRTQKLMVELRGLDGAVLPNGAIELEPESA
jgi:alkaline phosphatase D